MLRKTGKSRRLKNRTMKTLPIAVSMYFCVSCGGGMRANHPAVDGMGFDVKTVDDGAIDSTDGGSGEDSQTWVCRLSGGGVVHVPRQHRSVSDSCPAERGSIGPVDATQCAGISGMACRSDADCTAGRNGRCLLNGGRCLTYCSYDECQTDTDCPESQPCGCRSDGADTVENRCIAGSNCRIDTDCGECGFCSLSIVRADLECLSGGLTATSCDCGSYVSLAYHCHTMYDECADYDDCSDGKDGPGLTGTYCAYTEGTMRWECGVCTFPNFM
jgi:ribosomal protein L32